MKRTLILFSLAFCAARFAAAQATAPVAEPADRQYLEAVPPQLAAAPPAPAVPPVPGLVAALQASPAPPAPVPPAPAAPHIAPVPPVPPQAGMFSGGKGGYLGIGVQEVDSGRAKELKLPEERGVEVTTVTGDSPAEKAGLKEGDVVLEYNGQRVEGVEQFARMVRETPPGRRVKLLVSRNGASQTLTAAVVEGKPFRMGPGFHRDMEKMGEDLGREFGPDSKFQREMEKLQNDMGRMNFELEMPDMPQGEMVWKAGLLGIDAESVSAQLADFFGVKQGVLVRSVAKDSVAEKAGLKAGDVIVKVGDAEVARPNEITRQLRQAGGKPVALGVVRNRQKLSFNVTIESKPGSSGGLRPPRIRQRSPQLVTPMPIVRGRLVAFPSEF